MTLAATLADALNAAFTPLEGRVAPVAILWTDPDRIWGSVFEILREQLARQHMSLLQLGEYAPDRGAGPAVWLRACVDGGEIERPVLLLPSVSATMLRNAATLRRDLQPLVDLQYRGERFLQTKQSRDWTIATFLRSVEQGPGLDVAQGARVDDALARALPGLIEIPLDGMRGRVLDVDDFDRILVRDEASDLLRWMAEPHAFRDRAGAETWAAFQNVAKSRYGLMIERDGALQLAVDKILSGEGAWAGVWSRLLDAPKSWRQVCDRIRQLGDKKDLLGYTEIDPFHNARDNRAAEIALEADLKRAADLPPAEARQLVLSLEAREAPRRDGLWSRLGESPFIMALAPLARLAERTTTPVPGESLGDIADAYVKEGAVTDWALIETLAASSTIEVVIGAAARAVYYPWLDELARRFRAAMLAAGSGARPQPLRPEPGTLVLFVDGLRFDIALQLAQALRQDLNEVRVGWRLAPVPSVTATAKPLVSPVADAIAGVGVVEAFLPMETSTGRPATTEILRRAMLQRSVQILDADEVEPPASARAIGWTECAHIDADGHSLQARLATQLDVEVRRIRVRALQLLEAGWPRVRIVTDHGWLLVPGGLDPVSLPRSLAPTKWTRAAVLEGASAPDLPTLPWHWSESVRIACPPGAQAFRAGEEYSHGGLSPQECVIPDIELSLDAAPSAAPRIQSIAWRRMALTVQLSQAAQAFSVEVRRSLHGGALTLEDHEARGPERRLMLSADDADEGDNVVVVLLDLYGSILDQRATRIGDRS